MREMNEIGKKIEGKLMIIMTLSFSDLRGNGGTSTDWQVSDDKPPVTSDNWGQGDQGPSDLVKVVLLGAPGVGKTAIAQVCTYLSI